MQTRYPGNKTTAAEAPPAPTACPACRSADVTTTSKIVTSESYWRCMSCGEVWNAQRRSPTRSPYSGSFGR